MAIPPPPPKTGRLRKTPIQDLIEAYMDFLEEKGLAYEFNEYFKERLGE